MLVIFVLYLTFRGFFFLHRQTRSEGGGGPGEEVAEIGVVGGNDGEGVRVRGGKWGEEKVRGR